MPQRTAVQSAAAPAAIGAYSQAIRSGKTLYISGILGLEPANMTLAATFAAELQQILRSLDAILTANDLSAAAVVKTTVFLTDLANFPQVNAAYAQYFTAPYPARSCVQVSALPKGASIEIEAIAVAP